MTTLSTPQVGQPLDTSYLSSLINAINEIADYRGVSSVTSNSIWAGATSKQQLTANNTMFVTDQVAVPDFSGKLDAGKEKNLTINFPTFANTPVVTATAISAMPMSVTIRAINQSSVTVTLRVEKTGEVGTVRVNIIAIGKPA
jgi:hypothetical protein